MDSSGSLQERLHLVEIGKELGLKNLNLSDFQHNVARMVTVNTDVLTPPYTEKFCPLITLSPGQAAIITRVDAFYSNVETVIPASTVTDLAKVFLARWLDNLGLPTVATPIFKSSSAILDLYLLVNRPVFHVSTNKMVGMGISMPNSATFELYLAANIYVVSKSIATAFAPLETKIIGNTADSGGDINGTVDPTTGRQQTAPGV